MCCCSMPIYSLSTCSEKVLKAYTQICQLFEVYSTPWKYPVIPHSSPKLPVYRYRENSCHEFSWLVPCTHAFTSYLAVSVYDLNAIESRLEMSHLFFFVCLFLAINHFFSGLSTHLCGTSEHTINTSFSHFQIVIVQPC